MKHLISTIVLISIFVLLNSCNDEEDSTKTYDCTFEQNDDNNDGLIDDTERFLMESCTKNKLTSKSEIEQNIIGEWELVGHGEGWFPATSQPCGYIIISDEELTYVFKNMSTNKVTVHSWEIEEVNDPGSQNFILRTMPSNLDGLFMTQFCDNYMYGDQTPSDGNMYLYKKVR